MALKDWKFKRVDKHRDLWTKGDVRFGDFILIDKQGGIQLKMFPNDKYQVSARRKINNQTQNGHFKFFKTRQGAVNFVKRYLRKY